MVGISGSLQIQFTDIFGEKPKATVVAGSGIPGYSMTSIPDERTGKNVSDITEYIPIENEEFDVAVEDYTITDTTGDESVERAYRRLSVVPKMRVFQKKFALKLSSNYISLSGLYVNCTESTGDLDTQYVIVAKDFNGDNVGGLGYCYLSIPTDINDQADKDYYESIKEEGTGIDDIPHRTVEDYEWTYSARFALTNIEASVPTISGDGLDWPVSLDVLPPGKLSDSDGDVFNRVFEVQTKVEARHHQMNDTENIKVWIDKASMAASI